MARRSRKEREAEIVNRFIFAGLTRNTAKVLSYLLKVKEASTSAIERMTGLRQPEVSHAVKRLVDMNWVSSRTVNSKGRGRPKNVYFLSIQPKEIVRELYRVLHYPHIVKRFKPSKNDINEFIAMILERADITKGLYEVKKIKDDPTDNMFLACALEGKADYIVSRDPHLRDLKHYQGVQIVDATTFTVKVKE